MDYFGRDNLRKISNLSKIITLKTPFLKQKKQEDITSIGFIPIILTTKKTFRQRLNVLRPQNYSAGISAGLVYPFGDDLSQPSGYSLSINSEAFISPKMSIWADVSYLHSSYKVDKMSDAIGVPIVPPPSNVFTFNRAILKQPTIQYMLGLRYRFEAHKLGQPHIGLGLGAVTSLPYEVGYEFKNTALGTVWDIDQTVYRNTTKWGFLMFDAGIEKRLSKQYRWQLGMNYRINLSANTLQNHKLLGLKTGILYDF